MLTAKTLAIASDALDLAHRTMANQLAQAGIAAGAEARAKLADIEAAHAAIAEALKPAEATEATEQAA
jgi:hypothetical protein